MVSRLSLAIVECAGALGVAFGVLIQFAAIGLIRIMFSAIQKRIFLMARKLLAKHGIDGPAHLE